MRSYLWAVCLPLAVSVVFSFQEIGAVADQGAKDLFESKCSLCHSTTKPTSKKKTNEEWEATVIRMKDVNGAPLSDEEATIIIDYLAENYGN